jgi:DNA invertase Pin-like site-specific DNA recombinase
MKAFLYNRVSHKYSKDSGISIQDQIARASHYADSIIPQSDRIVICDEGVSAWSRPFASRPGGSRIVDEAKSGDHVICLQIDRLCRNLRDYCNITHHFEKTGVSVHYINNQINTSTSSGKLQANILAAMAQYASDITSERTKEALLIKRIQSGKSSEIKPKSKWLTSQYGIALAPTQARKTGVVRMYERVSSEQQYVSGLGLKWQETANLRYAQELATKLGCDVGPVYSDPAISAFSVPFGKRSAGSQLLKDLQPGDDVVIYRLDRGWRNTMDAIKTIEEIQNRGAFVHFVCERIRTDTGQGREWISLMASIAQLESQMKSNRIREAMAWCRATGRPTSLPRFGFKTEQVSPVQKKLAVDKKSMLRAAQIWVMKHEFKLTTTQIEDMLLAITAREQRRKANLMMKQRYHVKRTLQQVDILQEMVGESLWNKWKERGRASLAIPFSHDHLRLIRGWKWNPDASMVATA